MLGKDIKIDKVIGHKYFFQEKYITEDDFILYALSINIGRDPLKQEHFKFIYENEQNFQCFPTFSAPLALRDFEHFTNIDFLKGYDPNKILHGEEDIEIIKPLQHNKKYTIESKILDFQDKNKLTISVNEKLIQSSETKELYSRVISRLVLRDFGSFGHKGTLSSIIPNENSKKELDYISNEKILENQAALYRLNGDKNPIHIDPKVSKSVGFERPILHGLCTFGISAKSVYDQFVKEQYQIKRVASRFTAHVFPGESLEINMWKQNNDKIYYEAKVKERNIVALKGLMELSSKSLGGETKFYNKPQTFSGVKNLLRFIK